MGVVVNKYFWLAAVAALVIGFQNCSNNTQFVSDESHILKTTGDLVPVAADPAAEEDFENEDTDASDNTNSSVTPPPVAMPSPPAAQPAPVADIPSSMPPTPPVAGVPSPAPSAPPVMPVPVVSPMPPLAALPVVTVPPPVEPEEDEHEMEDADYSYVCILQGPGKSVKVGIVSDLLSGGNSSGASVCMSKRACLELMSQKFPVKAAERRGYCPAKNPNAVNMSDTEIKAKLFGH